MKEIDIDAIMYSIINMEKGTLPGAPFCYALEDNKIWLVLN